MIERLNAIGQQKGWPLIEEAIKLHGHASYRTYYRLIGEDGSTRVLMAMPEGKSSVSEEITNFKGKLDEPPFLHMARVMNEAGLPVPHVLHSSPADRWIFLEDVGDTLLADLVAEPSNERIGWYKQAIDLMVRMQDRMAQVPEAECIALQRSFDATLLNWEFDHFLEYAVLGRGQTPPEAIQQRFTELSRALTAEIEALTYGFTHRDFQSRNLMLNDGALVLLDFQDALQGPYVYDLVSLLRDSYITLTADELATLTDYYAKQTGRDIVAVRHDFDLVTAQRKMKDSGRFVFIDQVKQNPDFLQFMPASLGYVRQALERLPKYRELLEILRPYVPEWQ